MKKTTNCANRVAFKFTVISFSNKQAPGLRPGRMRIQELTCERIGEREHHRDTNTDQERRINQTSQQKHFGLQCVHQFWLTR
jgi:hypothetical protein